MIKIIKNIFGYYSVSDPPTAEFLSDYYKNKYYQNESGAYSVNYSEEEIKYFYNKIDLKFKIIESALTVNQNISILDAGCGEGFALNYFFKKGHKVKGIDFSRFALEQFNPHLFPYFEEIDFYHFAEREIAKGTKYDLIWSKHVLEHVVDPDKVIDYFNKLLKPDGIICIEVPNDFSKSQEFLLTEGLVKYNYWQSYPDHLNYFNLNGLSNLLTSKNLKIFESITDFPIEWNLFNQLTNYVEKKETGPLVHEARIKLENKIFEWADKDELVGFYRFLLKSGFGRELIIFARKNNSNN
jgi:2-polyprenyl-3-methyl-5-hydroxy-6-metoxy-1,4-benzoquinol methylase